MHEGSRSWYGVFWIMSPKPILKNEIGGCHRLNCSSKDRPMFCPRTYEYHLIGQTSKCYFIRQKLRSSWRTAKKQLFHIIRKALNANTSILIRQRRRTFGDRHKQEKAKRWRQRLEWCGHNSRNAKVPAAKHWTRHAMNSLPEPPEGGFWTSSPCKWIYFC